MDFLHKISKIKDWKYHPSNIHNSLTTVSDVRYILESGYGPDYYLKLEFARDPSQQKEPSFLHLFLTSSSLCYKKHYPMSLGVPLGDFNISSFESNKEYIPHSIFRRIPVRNTEWTPPARLLFPLIMSLCNPENIDSISMFLYFDHFRLLYILYLFDSLKEEDLSKPSTLDNTIPFLFRLASSPNLIVSDLELVLKPVLRRHHFDSLMDYYNNTVWHYLFSNVNLSASCLEFFIKIASETAPDQKPFPRNFLSNRERTKTSSLLHTLLSNKNLKGEVLSSLLPYIDQSALTGLDKNENSALHILMENSSLQDDWIEILLPLFQKYPEVFSSRNNMGDSGFSACMKSNFISATSLSKLFEIIKKDSNLLASCNKNKENFLFHLFQNHKISYLIKVLEGFELNPVLFKATNMSQRTCWHNFFSNPFLTFSDYQGVKRYLTLSALGVPDSQRMTCLHVFCKVSRPSTILNEILADLFTDFFHLKIYGSSLFDINQSPRNQEESISYDKQLILFATDSENCIFLNYLVENSNFNLKTFQIIRNFLTPSILGLSRGGLSQLSGLSLSSSPNQNTIFSSLLSKTVTGQDLTSMLLQLFRQKSVTKHNLLLINQTRTSPFILIHQNCPPFLSQELQDLMIELLGEKDYKKELEKVRHYIPF